MDRAVLSRRQEAFIRRGRLAHLATVDAAGEPFVVPVCYAWDGERFYTPIDEKPKRLGRRLRRLRNVGETGRATLVIDHYDDADWSRLGWLMARGRATIVEPDDPTHARAVLLLRERYPQYRAMALEAAPIIALRPERITSWGALDVVVADPEP
jgi:PPOX class probable F420-dependent enzyme